MMVLMDIPFSMRLEKTMKENTQALVYVFDKA